MYFSFFVRESYTILRIWPCVSIVSQHGETISPRFPSSQFGWSFLFSLGCSVFCSHKSRACRHLHHTLERDSKKLLIIFMRFVSNKFRSQLFAVVRSLFRLNSQYTAAKAHFPIWSGFLRPQHDRANVKCALWHRSLWDECQFFYLMSIKFRLLFDLLPHSLCRNCVAAKRNARSPAFVFSLVRYSHRRALVLVLAVSLCKQWTSDGRQRTK